MLKKLEMFIAVAKEEHFGRAADSLNITQPNLSAGIKQLEDQLGVQLIFRSARFDSLTPEGHRVLKWARKIVGDTRQLKEEMRIRRHGLSGQVRIAVIPTALTWAANLTARFSEKHPKVRFTIISQTSVEVHAMIENHSVDVGISYLDDQLGKKMCSEALYRECYMLICHKDSPFSKLESINWAELSGEKLCLLMSNMQNRRIIDRCFDAAHVSPEVWIESNSTVVLTNNVLKGGWLTVLPSDLAEFLCQGKPLKTVPIEQSGPDHTVGLVAPFRETQTPVLNEIMSEARKMSKLLP